jgi:hypothetical protein
MAKGESLSLNADEVGGEEGDRFDEEKWKLLLP